jgi:intracellular sulfur oxidation DsrE/DsrF family protein
MHILRKILLVLAMSLIGMSTAAAADKQEKAVYHVNDSANATAVLNNIRNHLNANPKAKIVVVTHGPGIDFLLEGAKNKNGNPYEIPVQELVSRNVEFRVCNNTLETRNIDQKSVIPEATIVPSGVAEISRLQAQEGYAYLKP